MSISVALCEPYEVKSAAPLYRPMRRMGVRQALEWAFGREKARLDLDVLDPENNRGAAVGLEWIIAQRGILGCKVDGGTGIGWGASAPAHDADLIAAYVADVALDHGGRRMAVTIAELAALGGVPDWMPNPKPKLAPAGVTHSRYGLTARTADSALLGREGWPATRRTNKRGAEVVEPILYCPVMVTPSAGQIAAARRRYLEWWGALLFIGQALRSAPLSTIEITDAMPPMTPWRNEE